MERVYDIYVNGNLAYQNISMDEENANAASFVYWLNAYGENENGLTEDDDIVFCEAQ